MAIILLEIPVDDGDWICVGGLKGFMDGSLGSHTAAFLEPYTDTPGDRGFLINDIEVLSDYTILFHMTNRKVFKNELPYRCFRLGTEKRFAYTLTSSLLCDDNIITVFSTGPFTSSCALGEFEELEEIEEAGTPGPGGMFMNRS